MSPNTTNRLALNLLCVTFICLLALVNRLDYYKMCYSKLLNVHNQILLNEQLSIDGLTDECCYIEPNTIKEIHNKDSDLGIIQINVRGLLNKQTQIKQLLSNDNVALPIEVILLCETWLKPTSSDLFSIPHYKSFHRVRNDRIGGGTSILVSDRLRSRDRSDLIVETEYLEHCVVELKTDNKNILLVSAYRSPNTNAKVFLSEYKRLLSNLKKMKHHEVIIGLDHNLDLLKSHLNQATNDFMDMNLDGEMIPCITKPTRITKTSATLIDNIMISRALQRSYDSFVILEDISDHFACLVVLKDIKKSIKGPCFITTRNLDDDKITEIISKLQQIDWTELLNDYGANQGFDHFHSVLVNTIYKIAPEIEFRVNRKRTAKDPWVSKGILNSIRRQKRLYLAQLRDSTITNEYKSYRNCLQRTLRKAKTSYFKEKCKEYKQDGRKLWKLIHELLNKKTNKADTISGIKVDGSLRYDPKTITHEFCKHFSSVGSKFANKIPHPEREIKSYLNAIPQNNKSLFLDPISRQEIETLIRDLVPKNSSGHDKVSNRLLKRLLPAMLDPLTILFNKSLSEGVFPEVMKKG